MPLPVNVEALGRIDERQRHQDRKPTLDQLVKPGNEHLAQYTIMANGAKQYGWKNDKGDDSLGTNCADARGWFGAHKISRYLARGFALWQMELDRAVDDSVRNVRSEIRMDWGRFNRMGIVLAWELKGEIGKKARVFYEKPLTDPTHLNLQRREIMDDGLYREVELVSRPGPKHCVQALR